MINIKLNKFLAIIFAVLIALFVFSKSDGCKNNDIDSWFGDDNSSSDVVEGDDSGISTMSLKSINGESLYGYGNIDPNSIKDVETLPFVGWRGTAVPNTGAVSTIYINNNLSADNVLKLFESLQYTDDVYFLFASGIDITNPTNYMFIMKQSSDSVEQYMLYDPISDKILIQLIKVYDLNEYVCEINYQAESYEFSSEEQFISNLDVYQIGSQNDLLSSLLSITEFEYVEEEIDFNMIYRLPDTSIYYYDGINPIQIIDEDTFNKIKNELLFNDLQYITINFDMYSDIDGTRKNLGVIETDLLLNYNSVIKITIAGVHSAYLYRAYDRFNHGTDENLIMYEGYLYSPTTELYDLISVSFVPNIENTYIGTFSINSDKKINTIVDVETLPVLQDEPASCYLFSTSYGFNIYSGVLVNVISVEELPDAGVVLENELNLYYCRSNTIAYVWNDDTSSWVSVDEAFGDTFGGYDTYDNFLNATDTSGTYESGKYYILETDAVTAEHYNPNALYRLPDGSIYCINNSDKSYVSLNDNIIYLTSTKGTLTDEQYELFSSNKNVIFCLTVEGINLYFRLVNQYTINGFTCYQYMTFLDFFDTHIYFLTININVYYINSFAFLQKAELTYDGFTLQLTTSIGDIVNSYEIDIDQTPTDGSTNLVTSGAVKEYVDTKVEESSNHLYEYILRIGDGLNTDGAGEYVILTINSSVLLDLSSLTDSVLSFEQFELLLPEELTEDSMYYITATGQFNTYIGETDEVETNIVMCAFIDNDESVFGYKFIGYNDNVAFYLSNVDFKLLSCKKIY